MRFAVALTAGWMLAGACAARLPHPAYTPQPTEALVEVALSPPPGRVEVVPARPAAAALWIDGEWAWRRQRWAWMPGRWVEPPAGATFSPWAFVRGPDGKLWWAPGVWRNATGSVVAAPSPLAVASVESGPVIEPYGAIETTGPTLRPGRVRPQATPPP
jgi:hypothetical protein